MNAQARPFVSIAVYMSALLAFIGAFIAFMRMQEEAGEFHRLRTQGVVSLALVTHKKEDTVTRVDRSGIRPARTSERTTHTPINVLHVRFEPRSAVPFKDFGTRVRADELPIAPPPTGEVAADSQYTGVMWVSDQLFSATSLGDVLVVVNTPFNRSFPKPVSEVEAFSEARFYPWLAGFALLGMVLSLAAHRIGRGGRKASAN